MDKYFNALRLIFQGVHHAIYVLFRNILLATSLTLLLLVFVVSSCLSGCYYEADRDRRILPIPIPFHDGESLENDVSEPVTTENVNLEA